MTCTIYDWHGKDPVFNKKSEITVEDIRTYSDSLYDLHDDARDCTMFVEFEISGTTYVAVLDHNDNFCFWTIAPGEIIPVEMRFSNVEALCEWVSEIEKA